MKKLALLIIASLILISCSNSGEIILPRSVGKVNKILVVASGSAWVGKVGDTLKNRLETLMVGLPQPEKSLSLGHVAKNGFNSMMKNSRNILVLEEADSTSFTVHKNMYAIPQTVVYVSAKDKDGLVEMIQKHSEDIRLTFNTADVKFMQRVFEAKKVDDSSFKTLQNLNVSMTIPDDYRMVDDTGEFLWLRHHLLSGVTRGAGSNNILVYSLPLEDASLVRQNILSARDTIGKRFIPGSKEGMYMITEAAYTPHTKEVIFNDYEAFETRGKWEVKNDFMAGPFLNYTILDKKNNRVIVVEGFTYAPSDAKRDFVFELESIAKSIKIN